MSDDRERIGQIPPRSSLTPKEKDALLADPAAAYAIEYSQSEHTSGVAARPMSAPAALIAQYSASTAD